METYRRDLLLRLTRMWGRLRNTKYGRTITIQLKKDKSHMSTVDSTVYVEGQHLVIASSLFPTSVPVPSAFFQLHQLS